MFSVVIPVWNARATLRGCVERVLDQTFGEFELIIVDDGSTDDGISTLAHLADSRMRVLRRDNGGSAAARNTGIDAARCEWIAFLDADDIWFRDHLSELDLVRSRFPHAGLIGAGYLDSVAGKQPPAPHLDERCIELVRYFERVGSGNSPFWIGSIAVNSRTCEKVGGFKSFANGDDSEFLARVALDFPVAASSRRTAVWVHGTGGITDSSQDRWQRTYIRTASDLSPAVALVVERSQWIGAHKRPPGIDAYIDRYIGWCLDTSVYRGDTATIRSLRRLFRRPPTPKQRLLLALGMLPRPLLAHGLGVASALKRIVLGWSSLASLRRSRGRPPPPATALSATKSQCDD